MFAEAAVISLVINSEMEFSSCEIFGGVSSFSVVHLLQSSHSPFIDSSGHKISTLKFVVPIRAACVHPSQCCLKTNLPGNT